MPAAPHPRARRIHDRVLQLVGTAMMKAELAEQLGRLGRHDDVPPTLTELRAVLDDAVVELRSIMAELRNVPVDPDDPLKNRAA
jgi:signal transduction histidine kinase